MVRGEEIFVPLPAIRHWFESGPMLQDHTPGSLAVFQNWFFSLDTYTFEFSFVVGSGAVVSCRLPTIPSFGLFEVSDANNPWFAPFRINNDDTVTLLSLSPRQAPRDAECGIPVARSIQGLVYRFAAERFNTGSCKFGSNAVLSQQAANLPEALNVLQGTGVAFEKFNQTVRSVLPQVGWISVVPLGNDRLRILVWTDAAHRDSRTDLAIGLNESGTGVGQVLAIVYIVSSSHTPQIMLIDEPQSFLHPGAARKLIEVLKQHPQHQYLIATHSPTIITAAKPETILLVTHDGNESHITRLDAGDADQLRKYLDEIGASLADVFGADGIIWVEGITEENATR